MIHTLGRRAVKEELEQVFKVFDKDSDGCLSFDEVREGYLFHFNKHLSRSEL